MEFSVKQIETINFLLDGEGSDYVPEYKRTVIVVKDCRQAYFWLHLMPDGKEAGLTSLVKGSPLLMQDERVYINLDWAISYFEKHEDFEQVKLFTKLKNKIDQLIQQGEGENTISEISEPFAISKQLFVEAFNMGLL